jgi:hypothetical protein
MDYFYMYVCTSVYEENKKLETDSAKVFIFIEFIGHRLPKNNA